DRKSTRLNSSHVKISYAVFCVKKKQKRSIIFSLRGNALWLLFRRRISFVPHPDGLLFKLPSKKSTTYLQPDQQKYTQLKALVHSSMRCSVLLIVRVQPLKGGAGFLRFVQCNFYLVLCGIRVTPLEELVFIEAFVIVR